MTLVSRLVTADAELSDQSALRESIALLQPRLVALARSMGASEPEDLAQTALEIAIRRADQLRDPTKLWSWVVSIQTREMFRWSRRLRMMIHADEPVDMGAEMGAYTDLRAAIGGLPPRMRACIGLHYMADMTVAETAQALGTSTNTVKTQLRIGLQRLKESLK